MLYPRRVSNADGEPLTGYGGPQRVYSDNRSPTPGRSPDDSQQRLWAGQVPGRDPVDESGNVDADFSPTGYDRQYRAPSKAGTPGNMLDPITHAAPPLPSGQAPETAPADPSHFSWNGSPYAGGGQGGSPTQFGNNFIGMQAYLNGNRSPNLTNQSFDQFAAGPSGSYSKNMNALDSSLYGFYGVKDTRPQATAPAAGTATAAAPPSADTPAAPGVPNVSGAADSQDTNFGAMRNNMNRGRQQRS